MAPLSGTTPSNNDRDEDARSNSRMTPFYISDDDADEMGEENDCIRELSEDEVQSLKLKLSTRLTRIPVDHREIASTTTQTGVVIKPDQCVEFEGDNFMFVKHIHQHKTHTNDVYVKGILLRRTRDVFDCLKKNRNELCAFLQHAEDDADPPLTSDLISRPLQDIIQVRHLNFTNQDFPSLSFRENGKFYPYGKKGHYMIDETAELVCRYKYVEYCSLSKGKVVSGAMMRLRESESSPGKGTSDVAKKQRYRGEAASMKVTSLETQENKEASPKDLTDLTLADSLTPSPSTKRRYPGVVYLTDDNMEVDEFCESPRPSKAMRPSTSTERLQIKPPKSYVYGDICAGAGGTTRGAAQAGLKIGFVLDHWNAATKTLKLNWPRDTKVLTEDIYKFCTSAEFAEGYKADILHCSFPCQTYSAAHTVQGGRDRENESAGYCLMNLLPRCKPRVVTMEQTSGLLDRFPKSFHAFIHQITAAGYSCRWKSWNLAELENVQPRKRLIIIASCPGEPLPPFPKATHGPGKKPFTTIADRLRLLQRNLSPHMEQSTPKDNLRPYDAKIQLKGCITTGGGASDLHPNGRRTFNMAELALLQGFPPDHKFAPDTKTSIRKQIGNAVPSVVAKKLFEEVKKSMEAEDVVAAAYQPEIIELD